MDKTLHIWLGKFDSSKQFKEFFKESYSDENSPINGFAKSQNKSYYDHDWMEGYFITKGKSQSQFLSQHVPNPYTEIVKELVDKKGIIEVNAIILYSEKWESDAQSKDADPVLWYLGEFNEKTIKSLRPSVDKESLSIETYWWTNFPDNDKALAELEKQSRKRTGQLPALAKLAMMYISGKYVEKNSEIAEKYLKKVQAYPELLHECFQANADAGDAEAWYQLAQLHARKFDGALSGEERLQFLKKAASLGSLQAKRALARLLMSGSDMRLEISIKRDVFEAEKLLLKIYNVDKSIDYVLFCLYDMSGYDIYNPEKAINWLHSSANRTGSQSHHNRLAYIYREGKSIDANPTLMCQHLYISECQGTKPDLEFFLKSLNETDISTIEKGRRLAKEWITEYIGTVTEFKGEKCDPFQQYFTTRV